MKETDRSALSRIFKDWYPLLKNNEVLEVENEHEPSFAGDRLRFRFDYEGKLIDFSVYKVPAMPEYE